MNIELDEVVIHNVSDDALELAAGGVLGGASCPARPYTENLRRWWC
jgi:hypothetical protein